MRLRDAWVVAATLVVSAGLSGCNRSAPVDGAAEPAASVHAEQLHCGFEYAPRLVGRRLLDQPPMQLNAATPVAFWSTWVRGVDGRLATADAGLDERGVARTLDYRSGTLTLLGLFVLRVWSGDTVVRGDGSAALVVCLSFDPLQTGSGVLPLLPDDLQLLRTAIERGILEPRQVGEIERIRAGYLARWETFQKAWHPFVASPRDDGIRDRFLDALVALLGEVEALADPARFFTRTQREALRRAGDRIAGDAHGGMSDRARTAVLRNYPIGEFVERWNAPGHFLGLPERRPVIAATGDSAPLEFDLTLEIPVDADASQQIRSALSALRAVAGLVIPP